MSIKLIPAIAVLATLLRAAGDTPLRSPWDDQAVAITDAPYSCPASIDLPHAFATNSYYIDSHHSVADPELKKKYQDSVAPIESFSRIVVKAADAYRITGSRAAAVCSASRLGEAANEKALTGAMGGHQAYYVQGWQLGAWAVAYLKIRDSGVIPDQQNREITTWLKKLAEENRAYYEAKERNTGSTDAHNNHRYWAGFAIAAAGIAADDRHLFDWGMDAYREGVRDIRSDGTLPLELARGQMALHYHLYALAPLMALAELGEANGLDLYAERDHAVNRLIARCIDGLQSPTFFQEKTGVNQVVSSEIDGWEIGWAPAYLKRFPNSSMSATISDLMKHASGLDFTVLGGAPPT